MRLYHSPSSPFVRKVMVLLLEAGQADQVTLIPAGGTPLDPGTMPLERNPLGKIPVLEREDGLAIYDSRVICRYLDDRFSAGMYPPAPRLWETLILEATADGILDAAILMRYEAHVRPEPFRSEDWIEAQWAKIDRSLATIEADWQDHLAGPLDMAQVAVGAALGYMDFRHGARDWRQKHRHLADWEAGFSRRPAMQETIPKG